MGALSHPGFAPPDFPPRKSQPLAVDCWKVPRDHSPDDAVRVPCLGGLSTGRLLQMVAMAGTRQLELVDRGWCAGCSAGGSSAHPVQGSLGEARSLLAQAGCQAMPELRSQPLPARLMPRDIPAPITEARLARRGFFSALAANAAVSVDRVRPLVAPSELRTRRGFEREPVPSRERSRALAAMDRISTSAGTSMPRALFHRVEVSGDCCNHRLCASVCPTGALAVHEQGDQAELAFDTALCIGCRQCSSTCPSGAMTVLPGGDGSAGRPLPEHPIRLTSFSETSCADCGRRYTQAEGEALCPQCRKRRELAGSAFRCLFGASR